MPFFQELKERAKVHHALKTFDTGMERHLLDMQQVILRREDSDLTIGQRELIAALVSAINECKYCRGAHTAAAIAYGAKEGLVEELIDNIDSAGIDDNLKPIFRYVQKLTRNLEHMEQADADAVFAAGWSSQALYDAISVCCVFNFMNRYVNGLGLLAVPEEFANEGAVLKKVGYGGADMMRLK